MVTATTERSASPTPASTPLVRIRAVSDWGNGNEPPNCNGDGDCTRDESCNDFGFLGSICTLDCSNGLLCPMDFVCCNVPMQGGNTTACVPVNNAVARFCQ
jgi:hypothetical protein